MDQKLNRLRQMTTVLLFLVLAMAGLLVYQNQLVAENKQAILNQQQQAASSVQFLAPQLAARHPAYARDVLQQYAPAAFAVAVTYAVKDTQGMEVPLTWTGVAFRLSPTQIVLPYEALEAWSFDPDISTALQSGAYNLEPDRFRLSVWSSGQAAPSPLTTDGGLQLGKQLHAAPPTLQATAQVMIPTHSRLPKKGRLDVRASSRNIAVLTATEALPAIPSARIASDPPPPRWDAVALLRFPRLFSGTLTPEVILTSAYLDNGRIRFAVNVDSTVFGSPIIAPNGIIGMVQDESSGIPLNGMAESMKSSE